MPRPGPRPYECVRRAWHSERHQPMRGSLIQEIFRIVNELHSTTTKKNKEWQEKLPVVVLKAEEIMYSKANSEAEYMDLKTLLDRTNDAINTIIRRDESTEIGELLPPCIEAALNLGCTPRRTSRSQRNNNPRCYLTGTQEPGNIENVTRGNHSINSQGLANYSPLMKQTMNATWDLLVQNISSSTNKPPFESQNSPLSGNKQCLSVGNYPASCSVYPLYYGTCFKFEETPHGLENFPDSTSNNVEPAKVNFVHNSLSMNSSTKILQRNIRGIPDNRHDIGCDLSLRLGPLSGPCPRTEHNQQELVKEVGSSSLEGYKFCDLTPQTNKQILFLSKANVNSPLDVCSSQWDVEGNVNTNIRKLKAVSTHPLEEQQFRWQPKLPCSQLSGRMRTAGL